MGHSALVCALGILSLQFFFYLTFSRLGCDFGEKEILIRLYVPVIEQRCFVRAHITSCIFGLLSFGKGLFAISHLNFIGISTGTYMGIISFSLPRVEKAVSL